MSTADLVTTRHKAILAIVAWHCNIDRNITRLGNTARQTWSTKVSGKHYMHFAPRDREDCKKQLFDANSVVRYVLPSILSCLYCSLLIAPFGITGRCRLDTWIVLDWNSQRCLSTQYKRWWCCKSQPSATNNVGSKILDSNPYNGVRRGDRICSSDKASSEHSLPPATCARTLPMFPSSLLITFISC